MQQYFWHTQYRQYMVKVSYELGDSKEEWVVFQKELSISSHAESHVETNIYGWI
jgi:hypothetical protein